MHVASGDLWAGAEVQVWALLKAMRSHAVVSAFLLNEGELARRLRQAGVPVTVMDERRHGFAALSRALAAAMGDFRPHIVHSHRYKEHSLAAVARLGHPAVRLLRTVHGAQETDLAWWDLRRRFIRAADAFIARRCERACVAVSQDLAVKVRRRLRPGRLEIIPNCVDLAALEAARDPQAAPGDKQTVGIVGRLVPVKRIDLFLAAAAALSASHPQLRFVVAGDGPLSQAMRDEAGRLGLAGRCEFTGAVANIAPLMQRLGALVISSDHEGLPTVLLEAMALGVPVVARAVGGIPEVVKDGESALLVKDGSAAALAAQVKRVFDEPGLSDRLTVRAQQIVTRQYSSVATAGLYLKLYESILGRRRQVAA